MPPTTSVGPRCTRALPDARVGEAVAIIRARRLADGTFLQDARYPGRTWFEVDVPEGRRSKWVTFFATRALDWWDAAA